MIIFNSSLVWSLKAESWVIRDTWPFFDWASFILASLKTLASLSVSRTRKSSPDFDAPLIPKISTGVDGKASSTDFPLSSIIALTFPHWGPHTKWSPFFNFPDVTIIFAIRPLPISIFYSNTIPVALLS